MFRISAALKQVPLKFISRRGLSNMPVEEAVNNILYNTPLLTQSSSRRILSCLVTNEPGVLSRISGVLAGRGFNIDSLVVSSTNVPDLSRMTIVLQGQQNVVEQARKQLDDLVPVWAVLDYSEVTVIERELALVKVTLSGNSLSGVFGFLTVLEEKGVDPSRQSILSICDLFSGKVVDLTHNVVTLELSAKKSRVDAFIALIQRYGRIEVVRSGIMAIPRSPVEGVEANTSKKESDGPTVDATSLPPG
jgi:acetolactate synthase-1/3 small subunit